MNNDKVKKILEAPDNLEPLFIDPQLSGFSGKKIVALLQNLVSCLDPQNEVYLEVGVFKGLSLLSVSKVFNGSTFGIDNFSQFDPEKKNVNLIMEQCARLGINNSNLINSDLEIAFKNLNEHLDGKKIGLYFIDGPHDYRSQFLCLLLAQPFLSDNAVIVIDDSNYRHVRQANDDFLSVAQTYKLAFEKYTKAHPHNMDADERTHAMENWWNGINVLVNDRNNTWQQKKINTIDSRLLYYNDQYIHSAKYADCAPEAIKVANALRPFRPIKLIARLINLYKNVKKSDSLYAGKFKYLNTYTDELV